MLVISSPSRTDTKTNTKAQKMQYASQLARTNKHQVDFRLSKTNTKTTAITFINTKRMQYASQLARTNKHQVDFRLTQRQRQRQHTEDAIFKPACQN